MEDKTNYDAYGLVDLLKLKKANLSNQSKLREESKLLDEAIAQCPEVVDANAANIDYYAELSVRAGDFHCFCKNLFSS